jgi:probable DNA repair protein
MGIEDAIGSAFDAVLFLRATDANWPRSPHPNPLLSWSLQQELAMPGASSSATIAHARSFTTYLLARSGNLLFFSAVENADGKLRPSPLLAEFSSRALPDDLPTSFVPEIQLENLPDDIHLPPLSSTSVKGGARVLKLQAACPFQAFATIRLQSNELRDRTVGFDAIEGGVYVHNILQYFWTEVGSQKNLKEMRPADRDELLHRCIESAAFADLTVASSWDAAYIALQKQRLHNLLSNWLLLELKRGPFVIAAMEQDETISIGPLDLRVRIDRIDRIDDPDSSENHFVYVDYKTGSSGKPSEWALPRPDDPQLPLYALTAAPNELHAIAFAKVRSGESAQWLGYQSTHGILNNGDPVDLDAEIAAWSSGLVHLAEDFAAGIADVDPKDFPATCKHCAQRLICRVNPESFLNPIDTLSNSDEESDAGALDE